MQGAVTHALHALGAVEDVVVGWSNIIEPPAMVLGGASLAGFRKRIASRFFEGEPGDGNGDWIVGAQGGRHFRYRRLLFFRWLGAIGARVGILETGARRGWRAIGPTTIRGRCAHRRGLGVVLRGARNHRVLEDAPAHTDAEGLAARASVRRHVADCFRLRPQVNGRTVGQACAR